MRDALAGLVLLAICCFFRAAAAAAAEGNVTLETISIFRTHEWLGKKPSLYFRCGDENKVELPDVKEKDRVYSFLGHESWQPLTEFNGFGEKCKRCGLYEKNEFLKDGVFDEWEFCPDGFDKAGRYVHFKEGEFNATFLSSGAQQSSDSSNATKQQATDSASGHHRGAVTAMVVVFSLLAVSGVGVILYTKWQQRKRREQQARFMKLFEEDDEFDMELGL